jgi:hypothetical protein
MCLCFEYLHTVHKRIVKDCSKTPYLQQTHCRETSTARSLLYHRQDCHRHTVGVGPLWPASFVEGEAAGTGTGCPHRSPGSWTAAKQRQQASAVLCKERPSLSLSLGSAALAGRSNLGQTATWVTEQWPRRAAT